MNLTSIPKIKFYRATPIPAAKAGGGTSSRGLVRSNFFKIDPDIINQQKTRTAAGMNRMAYGAGVGAGMTAATMENMVKGFVGAIFRKQQQRNERRERRSDVQQQRSGAGQISALVPAINANTVALNNLGNTINGIGANLSSVLKIEQGRYKAEKDALARSYKPTFDKREQVKGGKSGLGDVIFRTGGKFWEAITGLLSGLLKFLFIKPLLEWLADRSNQQKIVGILETVKKVFDFLYNFTKGRIVGIVDGLAKAFDGDLSWRERLTGLFGALGNLGVLLLGIRWLSNPTKIIKDVGTVLGIFKGALGTMLKFLSVPFKLLSGAARLTTGVVGAAVRNPLATLAIAGGGALTAMAVKNKYDNDPEFREFIQQKYGDISEFTQEQFARISTEFNKRVEQGREFLRGDEESVADNLITQAEELRQSIVKESTDIFNDLTGREEQVAPEIQPIGGDMTVDEYLRQYTDQLTSEVGERIGASDTQVNFLTDLTEDLIGQNQEFIDTVQDQLSGLNILPERSKGGVVPAPTTKKGGWIQGPQSGYPVSLDGGKSTSFIGHGTEYVSQKKDGSAFVIPVDTPDTRKTPGLETKRTQEAQRSGYTTPGFSEGGLFDFKPGGYKPKMPGGLNIQMDKGPKELKYAPRGGWITGPMSGYPVSVKGKNRPDFIAHGTEYISKKPTGEYTVLPFHNTAPAAESLSREFASAEGFPVPSKLPTASSFEKPSQTVDKVQPGKKGYIFGSIGKAIGNIGKSIGNLFGGGSKKDSGGGGGNFFSNIASGIGNFVGGIFGRKQEPTTPKFDAGNMFSSGFDFGGAFKKNPAYDVITPGSKPKFDIFGGSDLWNSVGSNLGNALGFGEDFNIGSFYSRPQKKSGWETMQDQARAMGNKWGLQYDEKGNVRGSSILPAILRNAGGLGKEIGMMLGGEEGSETGSVVGNALFKIFGGGGSGKDGQATMNDVLSSAGGLAAHFLKGKKGILGDIGDYAGIFFGPNSDNFTFGEKVALALSHGMRGSKYGKYIRPIAEALGVNLENSIRLAKMMNGEGLVGDEAGANQAAGDVPGGPGSVQGGGAAGNDGDMALEGGGIKAAIRTGKLALSQGFTVMNHPNFRNNKWSEFGANTGKGFMPGGGQKVVGGGLYQMGLGIDVADFRDGGNSSRLISFADDNYAYKQDRKLVHIAHDGWGSWSLGGKREGPGRYGYPEQVYLGFAKKLQPGSGSTLGPVQGGLDEAQQGAVGQAVQNTAPNATTAEKAAVANAITNAATGFGYNPDLGNILADYGVNAKSYMDTWDSAKLANMYNNENNPYGEMDWSKDLGLDLGLDYDKYMSMSYDPNAIYGQLIAEGKPEGEAENMLNAKKVTGFGADLKFDSSGMAGYSPAVKTKIPAPVGVTMGSGPSPNFITDLASPRERDFSSRTNASQDVSDRMFAPTMRGGGKTVPFIAPESGREDMHDFVPQVPKAGRGGADYLSASNDLMAGNKTGGFMSPAEGQGQQTGEDVLNQGDRLKSQSTGKAAQDVESTNAFKYATRERQYGQERVTEQSQRMVQSAIARVEAINADVKQSVAQAQQAVAKAIASSNSGGGGGVGMAAKAMTSVQNSRTA